MRSLCLTRIWLWQTVLCFLQITFGSDQNHGDRVKGLHHFGDDLLLDLLEPVKVDSGVADDEDVRLGHWPYPLGLDLAVGLVVVVVLLGVVVVLSPEVVHRANVLDPVWRVGGLVCGNIIAIVVG